MTMIERISRAIAAEDEWLFDRMAKSVLKAMREPTDAMIVKGDPRAEEVRRIWQAMIDTALEGK